MTNLSPEQIKELRELHTNASGGTWSSDLHGLYVTTDECPLCTPKYQGRGNIMLTSAPVSLDAEDKELIQIRGWGHLQKHKGGERVQKANANLIAAAHNSLPALLSMAERCVVLEELLREVCEWSFDREGETANEAFERYGELFYRDTGMLRPGKSDVSGTSHEERRSAWNEWIGERKAALESKVRAALTPTNTKDND